MFDYVNLINNSTTEEMFAGQLAHIANALKQNTVLSKLTLAGKKVSCMNFKTLINQSFH